MVLVREGLGVVLATSVLYQLYFARIGHSLYSVKNYIVYINFRI